MTEETSDELAELKSMIGGDVTHYLLDGWLPVPPRLYCAAWDAPFDDSAKWAKDWAFVTCDECKAARSRAKARHAETKALLYPMGDNRET